ncbi:MAG TPA: 2-hydroxychromene-2-carboxylate isomerase [Trinickia sp.]|jgi:2-hydroxychromene-2-carboxylate isomerase|uniref:2-hydroxychromene-2-carboxylate isomerase n=1 Tax=Trinickia sp. TaxID=2571163 RepID=UPI002C4A5599|nr:2-hydroxychromene-2-carboxylate isomerase [Trinickia sp.]HVW52279.1 2-hydroxychromene-2-carboxylate isomerase [Trinickia sp.]
MSSSTTGHTAEWFFDFVSPFAYLQLEQFDKLPATLTVQARPIAFGAILTQVGQRGPAEIPAKRVFTYRHALYRAQKLGIAYRMPPAHPFNSLKALRLAIAMGSSLDVIQRIFRFIWRDGHDVASPEGFAALCDAMDYPQGVEAVEAQSVKDALKANTDRAMALGLFGVPTFVLDGELFWGEDATEMFVDCIGSRAWLDSPEVRRVSALPVGVQRRMPGAAAAEPAAKP